MLICTDLDRTLLPNGDQPESPQARPAFSRLAARPEIQVAYVTGRHLELALRAVHQYDLPLPDYLATDVGTMIYQRNGNDWEIMDSWHNDIAPAWKGQGSGDLRPRFQGLSGLRDQPSECQNRFKLSYFVDKDVTLERLLETMNARLERDGIVAELVYSYDETTGTRLLDVLPSGATKHHAAVFLANSLHCPEEDLLFAGDSGNDLDALTSGLPAVLVANATDQVRDQARDLAQKKGFAERLYCARGGLLGMNGNYSAGILEGLVHFHPHVRLWLEYDDTKPSDTHNDPNGGHDD